MPVRSLSLLLAAAALLSAYSRGLASPGFDFPAMAVAPAPASLGGSPVSVAYCVRFAPPLAAHGEGVEVRVAWHEGRVDGPVPGLSPLQWRPEFWESVGSSWSQVHSRFELGGKLLSPSGPGSCELWCSVMSAAGEGMATETAGWFERSERADRLWSMSGAGASAGGAFERPLGGGLLATVEAGAGNVQLGGPLSEVQLYTQPGLRLETSREGWASAGEACTWAAARLTFGSSPVRVRMGLGWMQWKAWGTHRTDPGTARWIYEGETPLVAPDSQGETGELEQRWAGAVLPLHLEWQPASRFAVLAGVGAWWGALGQTARSYLRLYDDAGQPVGATSLFIESQRPACGWAWEVGLRFVAPDGACWRADVGPGGRVSVRFEVRA